MRDFLLWVLIVVQLILAVFLVRIVVRMALLTFFHKQTLPYVPIARGHIRLLLKSGALEGKKTIVDLGCGDGVLVSAVAKAYPNAELSGIECQRMLVWLARLRFFLQRRKIKILRGDMFTYPLQNVDAVVGWWIPDLTPRLVEKFVSECKPGCVIISAMFTLPPHPQLSMEEMREGRHSIFIYRKL
jgi:trans-aconitate methyltransferase